MTLIDILAAVLIVSALATAILYPWFDETLPEFND